MQWLRNGSPFSARIRRRFPQARPFRSLGASGSLLGAPRIEAPPQGSHPLDPRSVIQGERARAAPHSTAHVGPAPGCLVSPCRSPVPRAGAWAQAGRLLGRHARPSRPGPLGALNQTSPCAGLKFHFPKSRGTDAVPRPLWVPTTDRKSRPPPNSDEEAGHGSESPEGLTCFRDALDG